LHLPVAHAMNYIISLNRTVDHLDTTYGPFPSVDAAEAWLKGHGFLDDPEDFWVHRILELQPELPQDFIDGLAADKKANAELIQRRTEAEDRMERLKENLS